MDKRGIIRGNEINQYQTSLSEIINNKRIYKEELKDVNELNPFICLTHGLRFWRNERKKQGTCSFCNTFNTRINRRSDIMAFEREEGMNFVEWEEEGQEVIGKLVNKIENFGENDSSVYVIENDKGKLISIWETGFLTNLMQNVKIGDLLKIVYKGLGKAKNKGFNQPKLFEVFVDR